MERLTKMQYIHQTPAAYGERKGRQLERRRVLRILRGQLDPYDDKQTALVNQLITRILGKE